MESTGWVLYPSKEYRIDLHFSLQPQAPPPEIQGPVHPHRRTGHRGQCARQVHHTALGTEGRAQGWAQPPLGAPLLVSSVPVCSQRPKHLAEEGLWNDGASSGLGSL